MERNTNRSKKNKKLEMLLAASKERSYSRFNLEGWEMYWRLTPQFHY